MKGIIFKLVVMSKVYVTEPDLVTRVLELTICKGDVDFIKYLVTEQGVDVNGKPLLFFYIVPTHTL